MRRAKREYDTAIFNEEEISTNSSRVPSIGVYPHDVQKLLFRAIGAFCVLALLSIGAEAQLTIIPTTTLSAETSNNTSTSATFRAQSNGNARPGNVSKSSIRNLLYSGSTTKIYASVMPWFGSTDHMSVGYTSSDPKQISSQISDMRSRGIQGAIIPWYGPDSYNNTMAINFMQAAQSSGDFEFSLRIEGGALLTYARQNGCDVTTQFINDLNYIASTFYGSSAYTKVKMGYLSSMSSVSRHTTSTGTRFVLASPATP